MDLYLRRSYILHDFTSSTAEPALLWYSSSDCTAWSAFDSPLPAVHQSKEHEHTMEYKYQVQHEKGKYHAVERIGKLLDPDSFFEIGSGIEHDCHEFGMDKKHSPYDGVITGFGTIASRQVAIYSQDFTVLGGTLGEMHGKKIERIIELAIKNRCPLIGINDSGGARIQEGIKALGGYGDIFRLNTMASGYIPQISLILGPCAGGAVYSPGITDFVFVVDNISKMFVTGPAVVKKVLYEHVDSQTLGGARMHAETSGVAHFFSKSEDDCFTSVKELLTFLPQSNRKEAWKVQVRPNHRYDISSLVPQNPKQTYDMHKVIEKLFDSFLEVSRDFAKNIIVGFAALNGISIGVIANQPSHLAGVIDCDTSDKAARFVRFCDAFNIPLVTLVDVPGFMPGKEQENRGIIRHGSKLLYAYSEATVPKITVILRKAYGGAYIAMCSKQLGADFVYCWPKAEIAVMGAEGAVEVIFKREIKQEEHPEEFMERKIAEYKAGFLNPDTAVRRGIVDELIEPEDTRDYIFKSLQFCSGKEAQLPQKKHGNIPL